jgi:hypothetical protein
LRQDKKFRNQIKTKKSDNHNRLGCYIPDYAVLHPSMKLWNTQYIIFCTLYEISHAEEKLRTLVQHFIPGYLSSRLTSSGAMYPT